VGTPSGRAQGPSLRTSTNAGAALALGFQGKGIGTKGENWKLANRQLQTD